MDDHKGRRTASERKALIVESDRTVFLEVDHPSFSEIRVSLLGFAELEKSPENVHVYRITPLSLWNAAASGVSAVEILGFLDENARYPLPGSLRQEIEESMGRYGLLKLQDSSSGLELVSIDKDLLDDLRGRKRLSEFFVDEAVREEASQYAVGIRPEARGHLKVLLTKLGYPVEDVAGYRDGAPLAFSLSTELQSGSPFRLRPYQTEAVDSFCEGAAGAGSGVIVLPCGAGKTIVGLGVLERVASQALIVTTNITALRQWKREIIEKTTLEASCIGEYSGERKEILPVTLTTYQILTYRKKKADELLHFGLFTARKWGLIVYDEVHLLPAPVFRLTAEIQATRRLGLTATLVREDGREDEVFSLIGPRRYDVPWRLLEREGWIANASCVEVRVDMPDDQLDDYSLADRRRQFRMASENRNKLRVVTDLVGRHRGDRILIIGQYLNQLRSLQRELSSALSGRHKETLIPLITGKTQMAEREILYARFRTGEIPVLIVSKVGNFAVDLPDANIAIQVSGTFGSRQEEAQRLGRILRPKSHGRSAIFYSVVTRNTRDQEFAEERQLFLTEQGYTYKIQDFQDILARGQRQDSA